MGGRSADKSSDYFRKYYQKNRERLLAYQKRKKQEKRSRLGLKCRVCGNPIPSTWRSNVTCSRECARERKRMQCRGYMREYNRTHAAENASAVVAKDDEWKKEVIAVMDLPANQRWQYSRHWGLREHNLARKIDRMRMSADRKIDAEIEGRCR